MTGRSKPAAGALLTAPLTKGARRTRLLALSPIPARFAGLTVARDGRACCIRRTVTTAGERKGSWVHWEHIESHIFRPGNNPHCPLRPRNTGEHPGPGWISQTEASSVLSIGKVGQMIPRTPRSLPETLLCDLSFPGFIRDARGYHPPFASLQPERLGAGTQPHKKLLRRLCEEATLITGV